MRLPISIRRTPRHEQADRPANDGMAHHVAGTTARHEQGAAKLRTANGTARKGIMLMKVKVRGRERSFKLFALIMLCLVASMIGIILAFSKYFFNSDSAFFPLLAAEQIKSGKLFPPGMNYSTVVFVRTPNLVMIPFILLTGDLMLGRELGVIAIWILVILAVFWAYGPKRERNFTAAVISVSLIVVPYIMKYSQERRETTDQLFFQASYLFILFDIALSIGFAHRIILLRKEDSAASRAVLYFLFVVCIVLSVVNCIREDLLLWLPMAAAFVLFYYLESGNSLADMLRVRRCVFTVLSICIGMAAGFVLNRYFSAAYWKTGMESEMNFVSGYDLGQTIVRFVGRLTLFFGGSKTPRMMSLAGIYRAVNDVYAILLIWVVPIAGLVRYRKFRSRFTRFMILYTWISNFAIAYFAVSTGELSQRYYITIYLMDEFLLGAVFTEWAQRRKYFTAYCAGLILMLYACFCQAFFWKMNISHIGENPQAGLISFLEEHDLTYGYATYWNSYNTTVLSGQEIMIVSMGDHAGAKDADGHMAPYDPQEENRWLNNDSWYDVEDHPGRTFVILTGEEQLAQKYYSLQPESLTYTDTKQDKTYTILVFESNEELRSLQ